MNITEQITKLKEQINQLEQQDAAQLMSDAIYVPEGVDFRGYRDELCLVFNNGKSELSWIEVNGGIPFVSYAGRLDDKNYGKVKCKLVPCNEFKAGQWYIHKDANKGKANFYFLLLDDSEFAYVSKQKGCAMISTSPFNAVPTDEYYQVVKA